MVRTGKVLDTAAIARGRPASSRSRRRAGRARWKGRARRRPTAAGMRLALGEPLAPERPGGAGARAWPTRWCVHSAASRTMRSARACWSPRAAGGLPQADGVTFSGGVAEYIYGRERTEYADLGAGAGGRAARGAGRRPHPLPLLEAGPGHPRDGDRRVAVLRPGQRQHDRRSRT